MGTRGEVETMTTREEAFKEIDKAVWFEDCEQMSDEDERLISMGTLRQAWPRNHD